MNKIHIVMWHKTFCRYVVVSENVVSCGKQAAVRLRAGCAEVLRPILFADPAIGLFAARRIYDPVQTLMSIGFVFAVGSAMAQTAPPANALPTGGVVSAGNATISQSGSHMQINQISPNAALNWSKFDVGSGASVTFNQPSTQSVALNRVGGINPSQIYGTLDANGRLILINPNGVVFGKGSQINAAGLIATTKALSDADFMRNNYRFGSGGAGTIQNNGTVVAAPDGSVLLMADKVINTGSIQARGGTIGLLSGSELQASSDWRSANIVGSATTPATDVVLDNSGSVDVSGAQGGQITLDAEGTGVTQSSGRLTAIGNQGPGGQIRVLGSNVGLLAGSRTDASGGTGGGTVLVGGNWQGSGNERHAANTYMDPQATIASNAGNYGNGGKVVLWSEDYTNFQGAIQARGGVAGGDGGRVETSSKGFLKAAPKDDLVDVSAPGGVPGSWLLDPSDVTITSSGGGSLSNSNYNPAGATGTISNTAINNALNAGSSVTISTTAGVGGVGHLVQNADAPITKTAGGDANLNLIANLDLVLNGGISATAGKLNVDLDASGGSGNGAGAILVSKDISTNGGSLAFESGTYFTSPKTLSLQTAGGALAFKSDVLIADTAGLSIDTVTGATSGIGGVVTFEGKIDSGDTYSYVSTPSTWKDAQSLAQGATGGGAAVGDTYLATPLSQLQNLMAGRAAGFAESWLGGSALVSGVNWQWVGGRAKGQVFNTTRAGASPAPGAYVNWAPTQPDDASGGNEGALQFIGLQGQWNDLPATNGFTTSKQLGYVVQTNLAASPLTVNTGQSKITFNQAVGSLNPLASLTVTGPAAVNGGQVITEQGQIYRSPVTLGGVGATLLQSTQSSLQLDSPVSYAGSTGHTLNVRAAQDVVLSPGASITTSNGALNTNIIADANGTGHGAITLNAPITTDGGSVDLSAGSGITGRGAAITTGAGNITVTNRAIGDIAFSDGSPLNAGAGDITVTNGLGGGITGTGAISVQDLTGATIAVADNAMALASGQNAVSLNGPTVATGAVSITSTSGDVIVNQDVTSTAKNNASAIEIAAATIKGAGDVSGGDVKLINSKLSVDPTSRGVIYTGSIAGTAGVGLVDNGYPGSGHYRYGVAYSDTSRISSSSGTYVQYRDQPTLTLTLLDGKTYDATALNGANWKNYTTVAGWQNGDTIAADSLTGSLSANGNTSTVVKDVGGYTMALGSMADMLGYKLNLLSTVFNISPARVTVAGLQAQSKVYDATTQAQLIGGTLTGVLAPDAGNVDYKVAGNFVDKNVGAHKVVFVSGTLIGSRASNYYLDDTSSATTGSITPAPVKVSGVSPRDRVYDGTTAATFDGAPTLTGVYASDVGSVSLPIQNVKGHFADKNANSNKLVVTDPLTTILTGPESGNYQVVEVNETTNHATVTPAHLQIDATTATKLFDGTSDSGVPVTIRGLMPGDAINDLHQRYNSALPGPTNSKRLAVVNGYVIYDGNDGNNYIVEIAEARGTIKPFPNPNGMGNNNRMLESINLNLLPIEKAWEDIRQKAAQAEFLERSENQVKRSQTNVTPLSCETGQGMKRLTCL
ncbi:two-partner secretion domain-containing protein [Paraburkholderia kururiensis]|jgi:filamentous hemagglutinin family protein|uniref:two-partner secretion domain-containing protein n=1 Tax=Paraburkholderia kururiensis TaxID=984307 RepID=UPI0018F5B066|nr:YDG domain-containing protein [Paraburkholderia kururiensis]